MKGWKWPGLVACAFGGLLGYLAGTGKIAALLGAEEGKATSSEPGTPVV